LPFKCVVKWTNFSNFVSQSWAGMWSLFEHVS
jgi:hypothetical protein